MIVEGGGRVLKGELEVAGDKSISHRSIMLLSLSKGRARVDNILYSKDVKNTINIFRELGVDIFWQKKSIIIDGRGLHGLEKPKDKLYCGNSGTTMRLMSGILSGQKFDSVLYGDNSLNSRPMKRIIEPIGLMGGRIKSNDLKPPLRISGNRKINGLTYNMSVDSAQVKSAILLAGLYSDEDIIIEELNSSRNHTENMLKYLGVDITYNNGRIIMKGTRELKSKNLFIPGDISSAAYFIVAAIILEGSEILIKNVGINHTRSGIIDVLLEMNANIELRNIRYVNNEKIADIQARTSDLKSIYIPSKMIGRLVDEVPIISVAAAYAEGISRIDGLSELRVKETDRLEAIVNELTKAGVKIWSEDNSLFIEGGSDYEGCEFESYGDHRMVMAMSIMALTCSGFSKILDSKCIDISYPKFYDDLNMLLN